MDGSTAAVAEAVAAGLAELRIPVTVCEVGVAQIPTSSTRPDLLVVGAPTHQRGLSTTRTREAARGTVATTVSRGIRQIQRVDASEEVQDVDRLVIAGMERLVWPRRRTCPPRCLPGVQERRRLPVRMCDAHRGVGCVLKVEVQPDRDVTGRGYRWPSSRRCRRRRSWSGWTGR